MSRPPLEKGLHPRNRFRTGYDFEALCVAFPDLAGFVAPNAHGNTSIDYADPRAVKALNQALLVSAHGLHAWDTPDGALCPPVPGRSDHLHYLADLLASDGDRDPASAPRGRDVRVLDIGMGANCIYPLIGASEYGWSFVGTEVDPQSWSWAAELVAAHPAVADRIECRLQSSAERCFEGVIKADETFALSVCNPPFFASAEEAAEGNRRKRRNLGRRNARDAGDGPPRTARNFGGQGGELWCPGGELEFVMRMISQSAARPRQCGWFTTLVSRSAHLPRLRRALQDADAVDVQELDMAHGQKRSRILAWSFMARRERARRSHQPGRRPDTPE